MDPLRAPKYKQPETASVDYDVQPLLPYEPSRQGPPLAVADVNGDGLDDVFIGGGEGIPGKLFIQRRDGSFVESVQGQPWVADKDYDDWGALFFDANGDGLPDLYVASCGYQHAPQSRLPNVSTRDSGVSSQLWRLPVVLGSWQPRSLPCLRPLVAFSRSLPS